METHPDRGGDADRFALVRKAYETLIDPNLRDHYDRTGEETKTEASTETAAIELVAGCFRNLLQQLGYRPFKYVKRISDHIRAQCDGLKQQRAGAESELKLVGSAGMPVTDEDFNIFTNVLDGRRQEIARNIDGLSKAIAAHERALVLLLVYRDTYEEPAFYTTFTASSTS